MSRIVIVAAFVVATTSRVAAAAEPKACVAEDPEELTPGSIPDIERAASQDLACAEILEKFPKEVPTADKWNDCRAKLADTRAFCMDPLGSTVVTPEALATAHRDAKNDGCAPAESTIGVQSAGALGLGTPFQDDLLRGLTKFIVARAKAEAMAWAIDEIGKKVCGNIHAAALLPNSCALMNESDPGTTPMAWGTLKAAFETDLEAFPERAMSCVGELANLDDGVKDLLVTGVQATRLVREGDDPLAVLYGLTERFPTKRCPDDELGCGLHMLGYVAGVLTPNVKGDGSVKPVLDERRFLAIAARRVWDYAEKRGLDAKGEVKDLGKELTKRLRKLYAQILRIADKVKRARDAIDKLGEDSDRFQSVVRLARAVVDVVDAARKLVPDSYFGSDGAQVKKTAGKVLDVLDEIAAAVDAAVERDYARTFVHVTAAVNLVAKVDGDAKLPSVITRYGPFIAEVAAAKTPEDVQRALETAAAPVGGSLAKRGKGKRTIAINAFFGLHGGGEVVDGGGNETLTGGQASLYAAVGVEASKGCGTHSSIGLFLSVIDLGALTSLHFGNEDAEATGDGDKDVETTPEVGVKQVFSPGLYFVASYRRASLGVGASLTPKLRNVTDDGMFVEEASALRFGAFLALDITIFPF